MKKIFVTIILLALFSGCAKAEHYKTPFDTGGKIYSVALLPWRASPMGFDFQYRWTVTQALKDACKQSGAFRLDWSAYPVNGGEVSVMENVDKSVLWERLKYGRYAPVVKAVDEAVNGLPADLAVLYKFSANNSSAEEKSSMSAKDDYVRIFLVDTANGEVTVDFIRTNFLRKRAFGDIKRVTLRAFNKWLANKK